MEDIIGPKGVSEIDSVTANNPFLHSIKSQPAAVRKFASSAHLPRTKLQDQRWSGSQISLTPHADSGNSRLSKSLVRAPVYALHNLHQNGPVPASTTSLSKPKMRQRLLKMVSTPTLKKTEHARQVSKHDVPELPHSQYNSHHTAEERSDSTISYLTMLEKDSSRSRWPHGWRIF